MKLTGVSRKLVPLFLGLLLWGSPPALAQVPVHDTTQAPALHTAAPTPAATRLLPQDIGLVINMADPYSVELGRYYARKRGLKARQILRVTLPVQATLNEDQFRLLKRQIDVHFGSSVQALALAWARPYAVECNSITGALTLGFDAGLCRSTCEPSRPSPYANSKTRRPHGELGLRLTMLLAARDVPQAKAMVDRGVAALRMAGLRGAPPAKALLFTTADKARNVRAKSYPPSAMLVAQGLSIQVMPVEAFAGAARVLLVETGSVNLPFLPKIQWLPGGLGDHLTSYGGRLDDSHGQATVLDWITAGATASHGAVSEPCNHKQKFPNPQWLMSHYVQGSSAIEAYWKSVLWPQQSLFVGEPLAAPFARQ
jgi:uncharacterized protein (TIGR03790 family)